MGAEKHLSRMKLVLASSCFHPAMLGLQHCISLRMRCSAAISTPEDGVDRQKLDLQGIRYDSSSLHSQLGIKRGGASFAKVDPATKVATCTCTCAQENPATTREYTERIMEDVTWSTQKVTWVRAPSSALRDACLKCFGACAFEEALSLVLASARRWLCQLISPCPLRLGIRACHYARQPR